MSAEAEAGARDRPPIRLVTKPGAPLGAIFGGIGLVAVGVVRLLGLDRLPLTLCVFKGLTGLPCPTCGSTRALARLLGLDFAGALAMNPLTTVLAVLGAGWALADLVLLPGRRALEVEVAPRVASLLRLGALLLFLANWLYLVAAGR